MLKPRMLKRKNKVILFKTQREVEVIIELVVDEEYNRFSEIDLTNLNIILRLKDNEQSFKLIDFITITIPKMQDVSVVKFKNVILDENDILLITHMLNKLDIMNLTINLYNTTL